MMNHLIEEQQKHSGMDAPKVTRRGFLVGSLSVGGSLVFGATTVGLAGLSAGEALAAGSLSPNMWYDITPAGEVIVHITKAEIGQHVGTALAQSIAEELEADWRRVRVEYVDTDDKYGWLSFVTGGSWSVNWTFDALSRAGAAGRIALIDAAAAQLGVDAGECVAKKSYVIHSDSGRQLSYGELVRAGKVDRTFSDEELAAIELKKFGQYSVVGKPLQALDIPDKTNGQARYGIDVNLPRQVYATLVRPGVRAGAKALSVDDSAARDLQGFVDVLLIDDPSAQQINYVIALGDSFFSSRAVADAVTVEWELGPNAGVSTADIKAEAQDRLRTGEGALEFHLVGEPDQAIAEADQVVDVQYETEMVIHCPIEPQNATVEFIGDVCHVYTGNQLQMLARDVTASALGVEGAKVVIHNQLVGGAFGRRLNNDNVIPAALAAREIGRPVKLIYSREEDMAYDFPRSVVTQRMQLAIKDGTVVASRQDVVSGWGSEWISPGFLADSNDKKGKLDPFTLNTADHWYDIPNQSSYAYKNILAHTAVPPGNLRSVAPGTTQFAVECGIDEAAAAVGKDPVAFRLSLLQAVGRNAGAAPSSVGGSQRLANAMLHAVSRAGYGVKVLAENSAMGVASVPAQERNTPSWTCCVAEVTVNPEDGSYKVHKLTIAIDVGTAVNPDGVLAQTEGAALWGLSLATVEQATVTDGRIDPQNFHQYTPLRMSQVPELDVEIIQNGHFPSGCGEPGVTAVGPAIANAIYAAVGARVRSLPITAEKVLAAMSG